MRDSKIIVVLFSLLLVTISPVQSNAQYKIRETNRNYFQGDWTTWSTTRFVREIAIGDQYVYFATTGGITRYNFFSNQWDTPLTKSGGLADNNIFLVAMDFGTGYLWCTHDQGISFQEPASGVWRNFFYDELGIDLNANIVSLGFGEQKIFIYTSDNRYYESDCRDAYFQASGSDFDDRSDQIDWYGTKKMRQPKLPYLFMSDGYIFNESRLIINDIQLRKFDITCWVFDKWQNVWIGTWGLGAGRGDVNTQRLDLLPYGLWDKAVDAIVPDDRDRAFWVGGSQINDEYAGVTKWYPEDNAAIKYYEPYLLTGFYNDRIRAIAVDGDIVWFGTEDGLTRFDRKRNNFRTFTVVDNLVNNYVHDIVIDDTHIWVATEGGVTVLNKAAWGSDSLSVKHVRYPNLGNMAVYDIEKQNNLLWIATELGIYVYNIDNDEGGFYKGNVGPSDRSTFAISSYENEVWFGTDEGVAAFDTRTKEWLTPPARLYETESGINRILASSEAVWVATNSGVLKFDRERNEWIRFTVEDGLSSDEVYSLYLDGDYLWLGTAEGVTRFYWNSPNRIY